MKVLAVDDEQSIRELLAFQLQKHGYEADAGTFIAMEWAFLGFSFIFLGFNHGWW